MRIALITREYPPETAWGGIGSFYHAFADALAAAGHEVEVFTQSLRPAGAGSRGNPAVHGIAPRQWLIGPRAGGDFAGMPIAAIGWFALSLARGLAKAFFRRHAQAPFDVVEGHEHLGVNALIHSGERGRCASVTRLHTAYHSLVRRGLVHWPRSGIIRRLERRSLAGADLRIAGSEFIRRCTQEDFPAAPMAEAVVPHLVRVPGAAPPPFHAREKLIVFAGRMDPGVKRPLMAARAFAALAARFPDWRIEFAGADIPASGGGTAWHECEETLLPHGGRYSYHGALDAGQVQALYRRARIALFPSAFESFGLSALEAMAAGAVPVAADGTALPEVIGTAGVCFPADSQKDLTAALAALMENEPRLQELSAACAARVREAFPAGAIVQRNLELYERVARSRAEGR